MEKTYERRGKKTLTILIILRILPAFIFLFAIALLAGFEGQIKVLVEARLGTFSPQFFKFYEMFIAGGFYFFIILLGIGSFVAWLEYIGYRFMMDDFAFKIKTGIFNLEETSILYRQIQNVDVSRSLTYRLLGISKIVILTAGHEDEKDPVAEAEGIVDMLDVKRAEALQKELLNKAHVQVIAQTEFNPHEDVPVSKSI